MDNNKTEKPAAPVPQVASTHIILLSQWGLVPAGRVFEAVPDLAAKLDADKVKYRPATEDERRIGCPG